MKQLLIYICMVMGAVSCTSRSPQLENGDLLFQAGKTSAMSDAIRAATGSGRQLSYTHVGIFLSGNGADSVLEATSDGGVRMTTLQEFLEGSARIEGAPAVTAARLKDTAGLAASLQRARAHLGEPTTTRSAPTTERCIAANWSGRAIAGRQANGYLRPGP